MYHSDYRGALEKLLESAPKVRIMRLFVRNPEAVFTFSEVVKISRLNQKESKKELQKLLAIGLIKRKAARQEKAETYYANSNFELLPELRILITKASNLSRRTLLREVKELGKVELALLAGAFLHSDQARTDLLIVGNDIEKRQFDDFLGRIEAELGKPIRYTLMNTGEFRYRLDVHDRFLQDILEYPHEKLINKMVEV